MKITDCICKIDSKSFFLPRFLLVALFVLSGLSIHVASVQSKADEPVLNMVALQDITGKPLTLTVEEIRKLPPVEIDVTDRKGQQIRGSNGGGEWK